MALTCLLERVALDLLVSLGFWAGRASPECMAQKVPDTPALFLQGHPRVLL